MRIHNKRSYIPELGLSKRKTKYGEWRKSLEKKKKQILYTFGTDGFNYFVRTHKIHIYPFVFPNDRLLLFVFALNEEQEMMATKLRVFFFLFLFHYFVCVNLIVMNSYTLCEHRPTKIRNISNEIRI